MIDYLIAHLEKNFQNYEKLLKSKQNNHCCSTYAEFKDSPKSFADRIFLIERYRVIQRRSFYPKYGLKERAIDLLLSFNAKLRFPKLRLLIDLLALYFQTLIICFLVIFSRRSGIVEAGIKDEIDGILMYPSFTSYIKNIYRLLLPLSNEVKAQQNNIKHFRVTVDIIKKFQLIGLLILLPTLFLELSLFIRANLKNDFIGLRCLGTMCIINRFFAVILKENGYSVHLKNHGIVRDCVAEYGIFTEAEGYQNGAKPISEY